MSKDDQIQALQRRLKAEREDHQRVVNAKNTELRALRDAWELFDTYPALQGLLVWLHKIRDAAGPLRSPSYQTGHSADTTTQPERGISVDADRSRVERVRSDLAYWTGKLEQRLAPKGKLVDSEHGENPPPVCHNPECPAKWIPQSFDREICMDCKDAFTEHRPKASNRCWSRECGEYGRTGRCQHSWQKQAAS